MCSDTEYQITESVGRNIETYSDTAFDQGFVEVRVPYRADHRTLCKGDIVYITKKGIKNLPMIVEENDRTNMRVSFRYFYYDVQKICWTVGAMSIKDASVEKVLVWNMYMKGMQKKEIEDYLNL